MTAFILDLDGTLVDSVYQHVVAWHSALQECGMPLGMWRLHRKIGLGDDYLVNGLALELGRSIDEETSKKLQSLHGKAFAEMRNSIEPFAGANDLLRTFEENGVKYAIATTGKREDVQPLLDKLEVPRGVPVLFKEDAPSPKPSPDLFLNAAKKLDTPSEETMVVGDSVWDMLAARRAHFLGIGLLCGGYAESEMTGAGAFRVYADPAQLREHLHEAGVTIKKGQQ